MTAARTGARTDADFPAHVNWSRREPLPATPEESKQFHCRFCGGATAEFLDLGMSPPCESILEGRQLKAMEAFYPLVAYVCGHCFLVQIPEYLAPEKIFVEYAYYSGFSIAWLEHARQYAEAMTRKLALNSSSRVIEIGSNDGYLLQHFVARDIPVLGIDPAANVAAAAEARGVPTLVKFFSAEMAHELAGNGMRADLLVGNNVLAQVPNLNSFVDGMRVLLKPEGIATIEFPHILKTIAGNQFDQFYHEHYSYFSASTAMKIFSAHGLRIFDFEELWTHGGSLRLYICHAEDMAHPTRESVAALVRHEQHSGLERLDTYIAFAERIRTSKRKLLSFLTEAKERGKTIVGYGAPGKGNTLLNYCGVRQDFLDYTVDRNPYKHGKYLPGTHIPIFAPEKIAETKPDYVLILAWNLKDEIAAQLAYIHEWGAKFVVPIPEVWVFGAQLVDPHVVSPAAAAFV